MRKINALSCIVLASSLVLTGCVVDREHAGAQTGALSGAVAGGLIGSTIGGGAGQGVASIVGAMVGGAIGSNIGDDMDEQSKARAQRAYRQAMHANHPVGWHYHGYQGQVTPAEQMFSIDGRACKRFTMTLSVGDHVDRINGTSCHYGPKGWLVVEEQVVMEEQKAPVAVAKPFHKHPKHKQSANACHCHCYHDVMKHNKAW